MFSGGIFDRKGGLYSKPAAKISNIQIKIPAEKYTTGIMEEEIYVR